jgi:WD40 repeat protein
MITIDIGKYRQKKPHRDTLVRMRYSPKGRYLVSADKSGEIILWTQANMREPRRFYSLTETLTDVWFSEDEKWLLIGHQGGKLRIYEVPQMKLVADIQLKPERSEDSTILSGTSRPILNYVVMASSLQNSDYIFVVLEFRDFFLLKKDDFQVSFAWHSSGNLIEQTAMTVNGKEIYFGDDLGIIYRYQLADKTMSLVAEHREIVAAIDLSMRKIVMEAAPGIAALALSVNGLNLISTSYSGGVQVWNTDQNLGNIKMKPIASKEPRQKGRTRGVGFFPQSTQVALGSDDGLLEIWDFNSKEILYQANCTESIRSLDISPIDDTCAIGCKDGAVFLLPWPGRKDESKKEDQPPGWMQRFLSRKGQ